MAKNEVNRNQTEVQKPDTYHVKLFTAQGDQREQYIWTKQEDGTWMSDRGGHMDEQDFRAELDRYKSRQDVELTHGDKTISKANQEG